MKASELRIGNYVSVMRSLPHQVTGEHLYMMQTYKPKDPNEADYSEMTAPIPLTEEWLLKFGFDKENTIGGWLKWSNRKMKLLDMKFYFDSSEYFMRVEYVHQLQNLYFALTGEELTIKE